MEIYHSGVTMPSLGTSNKQIQLWAQDWVILFIVAGQYSPEDLMRLGYCQFSL